MSGGRHDRPAAPNYSGQHVFHCVRRPGPTLQQTAHSDHIPSLSTVGITNTTQAACHRADSACKLDAGVGPGCHICTHSHMASLASVESILFLSLFFVSQKLMPSGQNIFSFSKEVDTIVHSISSQSNFPDCHHEIRWAACKQWETYSTQSRVYFICHRQQFRHLLHGILRTPI